MDQIEYSFSTEPEENKSTILFLGLFLLILCFFILLVSISSVESKKSTEVLNSLTSTFADVSKPVTTPVNFISKSGEALGPEDFLTVIEGVFTTAIKVDKVHIVQPGRIMEISFLAQELFLDNEAKPRATRHDLIDRMVASLSASVTGYRFEMVMIMERPHQQVDLTDQEASLSVPETLEMKRVGAFLRAIIERGADPASLSGGLKPGSSTDVTMRFSVHETDEPPRPEPDLDNRGGAVQ